MTSFKSAASVKAMFGHALVTAVTALAISGCGPRGETVTLDQVLENSRAEYRSVVDRVRGDKLDPGVGEELKDIEKLLGEVSARKGREAGALAEQMANKLSGLTVRAGYTTRPALTELINQYQAVADRIANPKDGERAGDAELRLLAARTYSLLSSELEGVKFALKERESRV